MTDRLRFVSDDVFAEADPPEDRRSDPLEWRRSFNLVHLEIGQLMLETAFEVNEVDLMGAISGLDATEPVEQGPRIQANAKTTRKVRGVALQEDMRDTLLRTGLAPDDPTVFQLRTLRGDISVTIVDSEPTAAHGEYGEGSFPGILMPVEGDDGGDVWTLELCIPSAQMDGLVARLRAGEVDTIAASVAIQSFSDEVDDALRDWHHRRRLFIHRDSAAAPCRRLVARKCSVAAPVAAPPEPESSSAPTLTVAATPPVPHVDYTAALAGIKVALWALAAVEFLRLLK